MLSRLPRSLALVVPVVWALGSPGGVAEARAGEGAGESGTMTRTTFGKTAEGQPVELYVLSHGKLTAKIMTYGGIITDIGAHQTDHFLFFTGSTTAEVVCSQVGNLAHPDEPGLEDFGDAILRGVTP